MPEIVITPPSVEPISLTEAASYCRIDESNQEPAPGLMAAVLGTGVGNVTNGAHRYRATFVTADGETQGGDATSAVTVIDKAVNGRVNLSNIPIGGANVIARKIYRTAAGGTTYQLVTTLNDNSTTTFQDNVADLSLGAQAPSTNTTKDTLLRMFITSVRQAAETRLRRYLITQTVDVYLDSFSDKILLPPYQTITSITYFDSNGTEQTLATNQYIADAISKPGRVTPAYGVDWPETLGRINAVKVRLVVGYGNDAQSVPACVRHWMGLRLKHAWDNRDPVNTGNIVTEFPYSYIDGLLDSEICWGR